MGLQIGIAPTNINGVRVDDWEKRKANNKPTDKNKNIKVCVYQNG